MLAEPGRPRCSASAPGARLDEQSTHQCSTGLVIPIAWERSRRSFAPDRSQAVEGAAENGRRCLQERGKRADGSDSLAPICRVVAPGAIRRPRTVLCEATRHSPPPRRLQGAHDGVQDSYATYATARRVQPRSHKSFVAPAIVWPRTAREVKAIAAVTPSARSRSWHTQARLRRGRTSVVLARGRVSGDQQGSGRQLLQRQAATVLGLPMSGLRRD